MIVRNCYFIILFILPQFLCCNSIRYEPLSGFEIFHLCIVTTDHSALFYIFVCYIFSGRIAAWSDDVLDNESEDNSALCGLPDGRSTILTLKCHICLRCRDMFKKLLYFCFGTR